MYLTVDCCFYYVHPAHPAFLFQSPNRRHIIKMYVMAMALHTNQ
jgi:hypothetical protein